MYRVFEVMNFFWIYTFMEETWKAFDLMIFCLILIIKGEILDEK